jgi:gamma-glutamylcyclotransferase
VKVLDFSFHRSEVSSGERRCTDKREGRMKKVLYLAYGSNLDVAQMRRRCPKAQVLGTATLRNHELAFHGYSARWGGSVATIRRRTGGCVNGLVYALTLPDLERLDRCEGVDLDVYERVARLVSCWDGRRRRVQTYALRRAGKTIKAGPSRMYITQIWCAYARLGFDRSSLWRAVERAT